jgi:hypothetical protein
VGVGFQIPIPILVAPNCSKETQEVEVEVGA